MIESHAEHWTKMGNGMNGRLEGLTVFVTAAGAGIGLASARACWREGATVWATDRSPAKMPAWPDDPRWIVRRLDVTDDAAMQKLMMEAGKIDVLFCNAGWVPNGTVLEASDEDWERAFSINVRSMFVAIRMALPGMIEAGEGRIITMASVVSSIKGARNRAVYGATKAAVIGLTRSVAVDFADRGITAVAVCSGVVDTPSMRRRIADSPDPAAAKKAFMARHPVGRFASAEEIAELMVYLASPEARFMTGTEVIIDGGWSG
jgi:2-keto-3-deoxy-L-fuconate dehydrogenase